MAWGVLSHRGATTRGERAGSSGAAARPLHGRTTRGGLHRVLVLLLAATVVVVVMIVLRLVTGSADDVGTTNGSGVGGLMRWPRSSAAHRGDRASSLRVSVLVWPTSFSRLERHAERIEGIVETWASQEHWCGVTFRFRFAVGLEDEQASLKAAGHPSLESALGVNSRHRLVMSQSSKTPGANLLRAMRDALLVDKSDWIVCVDSVTFLVPANLARLLWRHTPSGEHLLVLGSELATGAGGRERFVSGGAGYAMSSSTANALIRKDAETDPNCLSKSKGGVDVQLAACLQMHFQNVTIGGAQSRAADGCSLFNTYGLVKTIAGTGADDWFVQYQENAGLNSSYLMACGLVPDAVSLHYVEAPEARALWHDLRGHIDEEGAPETVEQRRARYPVTWNEAGGYSKLLPTAGAHEGGEPLLSAVFAQIDAVAAAARGCG